MLLRKPGIEWDISGLSGRKAILGGCDSLWPSLCDAQGLPPPDFWVVILNHF